MTTWWSGFFDDEYAAFGLANDPPEVVEQAADFIVKTLDLKPGERVFDQCCGIGRISVPLAQRGMHMVGVDLTESYVREAQRRAEQAHVECQFEEGDAFAFVAPQPCDAAINWFTSFAYSTDHAINQRQLQNIFDSLRPGGRFIMDFINIARVLADFRQHLVSRPTSPALEGLVVLQEHAPDFRTGMLHSNWTFFHRDGRRVEKRFAIRMYMAWDIVAMLERCGFRVDSMFGSVAGEPYDRLSKRLIVAATRPA